MEKQIVKKEKRKVIWQKDLENEPHKSWRVDTSQGCIFQEFVGYDSDLYPRYDLVMNIDEKTKIIYLKNIHIVTSDTEARCIIFRHFDTDKTFLLDKSGKFYHLPSTIEISRDVCGQGYSQLNYNEIVKMLPSLNKYEINLNDIKPNCDNSILFLTKK